MRSRLSRVAAAVDRLAAASIDHVSLRQELDRLLRRNLGYEAGVWALADPTTATWSHCVLEGMPRSAALESAVFDNEYRRSDVLKLADLAAAERPAGSISMATGGDPAASERMRELYRPAGIRDEARLALVDRGTCWGCVALLRGSAEFRADEIASLASLSRPIGRALRQALLRAAPSARPVPPAAAPGLVILDPMGGIESMSAEAAAYLGDGRAELPAAAFAVAARSAAGHASRAVVPCPDGRWLAFAGAVLGDRSAVIVQPAGPLDRAEVIARAAGLTPREREIIDCLARGLDTRAIAGGLGISAWTVQDHLKALFAKLGVDSRQELIAAVFFGVPVTSA